MNKSKLRTELRNRRKTLTAEEQDEAALRLAAQVNGSHWFRTARHIACYFASDGEIDPILVVDRVWQRDKTCYLPVISHLSWDRLWFAPYWPNTPLMINRFGIPEPDVPRSQWVRATALDVVFMPLVGFDVNGNRIGMGAGFYDHSLAYLHHRRYWRRPRLVGLAHETQKVKSVPVDPWDIPLHGIITDQTIYATSF